MAALEGRASALSITRFLRDGAWREGPVVPVVAARPLRWISPNALVPGPAAVGPFVARVAQFVRSGRLEVRQGERILHEERRRELVPNRPLHLGGGWVRAVAPEGGPVTVAVVTA